MNTYELVFNSVNSTHHSLPIRVLIIEPPRIDQHTGAMLFTHGWGGNRFQHRDKMEYASSTANVVAVSTEFRQSGYDFNPTTGTGYYVPYDASFMQVFDVINSLRFVLDKMPHLNRSRLFHYGGSQGGHIALLSAIFAPDTFAFVYASCPITAMNDYFIHSAGRSFAPHELAARDAVACAEAIRCPVYLEHGTADETVPHQHSQRMEQRLSELGIPVKAVYYPGGAHNLEPTITKLDAFKHLAPEPMSTCRNDRTDDFTTGNTVSVSCADRTLCIDYRTSLDDMKMIRWEYPSQR